MFDSCHGPDMSDYQLMIPQMPILGPHDFDRILSDIHQSVVDEATAAEFYSRLLREAPDDLHERFIDHAMKDELEHLQAFEELYLHFTGTDPEYVIEPVEYETYREGILIALEEELEAAEFYRDVILSSTDRLVRDTFFLAMVDELEHATQFGVLFNTLD